MKKIILFILLINIITFSQNETYQGNLFGKGAVLVYTVFEDGNPSYSFLVKIIGNSSYKSFDYGISYTGPNAKGTIIIDESANENATGLKNYFGSGYDELRDDITTVFLSKKMFNDILENKKTSISLDGKTPMDFEGTISEESVFIFGSTFMRDYNKQDEDFMIIEDYGYTYVDGLKSTIIENNETGYNIIFWNNPLSPIILYMNIGFEIRLDAIL